MGRLGWVVVCGMMLGGCEGMLCEPGETQRCVCSGNREGGQVCAEDGQRWSLCDCSAGDDDDTAGTDDDDSTPDDDDDDSSSPGDDDDTAPPYTGEIQLGQPALWGTCTATVEVEHGGETPEGWFELIASFDGWASVCYVNFWDNVSDYCEAWDSFGNPCEMYGFERGGWAMTNALRGWDKHRGHWDEWSVHIEYIMDLYQADVSDRSIFICENAGENFTTEFCCRDEYTDNLHCVEYLWP